MVVAADPDESRRRAACERPAGGRLLIALHPDPGGTGLVLMRRSDIDGDVHSGQLSLPGGGLVAGERPSRTRRCARPTKSSGSRPPESNSSGS